MASHPGRRPVRSATIPASVTGTFNLKLTDITIKPDPHGSYKPDRSIDLHVDKATVSTSFSPRQSESTLNWEVQPAVSITQKSIINIQPYEARVFIRKRKAEAVIIHGDAVFRFCSSRSGDKHNFERACAGYDVVLTVVVQKDAKLKDKIRRPTLEIDSLSVNLPKASNSFKRSLDSLDDLMEQFLPMPSLYRTASTTKDALSTACDVMPTDKVEDYLQNLGEGIRGLLADIKSHMSFERLSSQTQTLTSLLNLVENAALFAEDCSKPEFQGLRNADNRENILEDFRKQLTILKRNFISGKDKYGRSQPYHRPPTPQAPSLVETSSKFSTFEQVPDPYTAIQADDRWQLMSFLDPYFVPTPLVNLSCLDSTRSDLLSKITAWFDRTDEPNVLWISGAPGSGKTSIAWSLIAELEKRQRSAGEFFFRPSQHTPQQLWRTMAFKMAEFHPAIKCEINKALKTEGGLVPNNITLTFEKLVAGPLQTLDALLSKRGPILLIDDLEQCDRRSPYWQTVLDTFPLWLSLPRHCKLIITSRHQPDVAKVFENKDIKRVELLTGDDADDSTDSDVRTYLNHRFTEMKGQDNSIPKDWPRDDAISKLVEHAKGFFKWAALVVDDIQKSGKDRDNRLMTIVENGTTTAVNDFDPYLEQIFQTEFESDPPDAFLATMATIALSKRPLTFADLEHFLRNQNRLPSSTEESLDDICHHLLPIVSIDSESGEFYLRHKAYQSYMTDPKRCTLYNNRTFLIERSKVHREIAISSLKIMEQKLKFNICGLKSSYQMNHQIENKIEEYIPSHLAYSCQFWADHLRDIGATEKRDAAMENRDAAMENRDAAMETRDAAMENRDAAMENHDAATENRDAAMEKRATELVVSLKNFLNFQLLYWLEALSLLSKSDLSSRSLLMAAQWLEATDKDLSLLAADASRFSVTFADVISESAPHIYLSALPFAPPSCLVSKRYRDPFSRTIKVLHEEEIKWPSMRFSIPTNRAVNSVSIHPEGKRVAAAMRYGDAMVFSMTLGETLFPLSGHDWSTIRTIAYSPNGKRIATGSQDGSLRICNAENGSLLFGPFELHSDWIRSIAWSPDGQRIVTCSDDVTVKVVATETGVVIHDTALHNGWVRTVLYTTGFFISGSDDRTAMIYDASTGEALGEAWSTGQAGNINAIAISPDKKILAAGSDDCSIVLYDMESRTTMMNRPMRGHTQSVISLAFSTDGQWLASGSEDCTVRLWNVQTGQKLCDPLYGHTSYVNCVRFSPGMKQLVTGDEGRSIRFFDLDALRIQRNAQRSTGTLPIQDNAEGGTGTLPIQTNAQGGTGMFLATIACHDGHTILASDGSIISRWNVNNGNVEKAPLEGEYEHLANVQSVSISPNGQLIVTAAKRTMMIWEAESGAKLCGPLDGHEDVINALNFSADSKKVVSGSDDRNIRIWSAKTGQSIGGPMKGHDESVRCVCFSPDGKQVASGSYDTTAIIWSVESGEKVHEPLTHHAESINAVSYSPNGLYLATASNDYTVAICDVVTGGQNVSRRLTGHGGEVKVLSWSPDSEKIISGASDNIIRVFEVETSTLLCEPLTGHTNEVTALSFRSLRHSKEQQIVSCSLDGTVRVWELRIKSFVQTQRFSEGHDDWVHAIAFSPLDDSIASGDDEGRLVVMDAVAGTEKFSKDAHNDWIRCVTYSPDGKRIATCSLDGVIYVWDAESSERLLELPEGHTAAVLSIKFSPDGKFLVSGSEDKTVRTWDALPVLDRLFDISAYHGHTGAVNAVAYADGGKLIVSGSATGEIAVLDVLNGRVGETSKRQFSAHGGAILSICVFGKKIFSSSEDKTIRVWELHTGHAPVSILHGHTGPVNAIALTPDGKRIISASDDGSLRIFHSDNGEACTMPFDTSNRIFSVAVSHRGTLVASGGEDMSVRIWRANMEGRAVWPDDFIRKVRTLEFCVVDERGVLEDFTMQSDGWLLGRTGDRICWIPPFCRTGLWTPRTVGIIGVSETILDFRSLVHGTNWEQCRVHDSADKA